MIQRSILVVAAMTSSTSWSRQPSATNSRAFFSLGSKSIDEVDSSAPTSHDCDTNQVVATDEHFLKSVWTQWHLDSRLVRRNDDKSWIDAQRSLKNFGTVEGFFRIYKYIKEPSQLLADSGYSIFRRNIWPGWEDRNCRSLLRYSYQMPPNQISRDSSPLLVDQIWLHMVLHMIGADTFGSDTDFICGVMVTDKKHGSYRFEYWLNTDDKQSVQKLTQIMKQFIYDIHLTEPESTRKRVGMNDIKIEFNLAKKKNY